MDFHIRCACGRDLAVTEGAAGGSAACDCGREVSVPSLRDLRVQAGLAPFNASPELVIEHILATGQHPGGTTCVQCGLDTGDNIHIIAECERRWTHRSGGFSWMSLLISALFLPVQIFAWEAADERQFGKNKIYRLPLPVCRDCLPGLRSRSVIVKCLQTIPEYARLLEKFPNATLTVDSRVWPR